MSTVASHKIEPRFEIVQDEANSVGELQQLKKQIVRLEQENAELQALLEQDVVFGVVSRSHGIPIADMPPISTVRRPLPVDLPELED